MRSPPVAQSASTGKVSPEEDTPDGLGQTYRECIARSKLRERLTKHAGPAALDLLEPLMARIRMHVQLKEKKRGSFYRKGKGFLHFHEDPAGLFADVCTGAENLRLRVSTRREQKALLSKIQELLREA